MKTIRTALVSTSNKVDFDYTTEIAAALQKQLTNHFFPIWKIPATITAFASVEQVPADYWPITIKDVLTSRHEKHTAQVSANQPLEKIPVTCSHELLEMLADPTGEKVSHTSIPPLDQFLPAPLRADTPVKFAIEICDPCQTFNQGYKIDNVQVCNFCTPQYYHADGKKKRRFYQGGSGFAREVLGGGYVSFQTPDNRWWQTDFFSNFINTAELIDTPVPAEIVRDELRVPTGRTFGKTADPGLLSTIRRPFASDRGAQPPKSKPTRSI